MVFDGFLSGLIGATIASALVISPAIKRQPLQTQPLGVENSCSVIESEEIQFHCKG